MPGPRRRRLPDPDRAVVTAASAAVRTASSQVEPLTSPAYEVFMVLLSGLSIFNTAFVVGAWLTGSNGPSGEVVRVMDAAITPLFVFDFLHRFRSAPSRHAYFVHGYGWADLVATVPILRIFRLPRTAMVVRAIRTRGTDRVLAQLSASRAVATFLFTVFLVVAVVEFASATIYYAEKGAAGANIASAGDAIWWALVTITTVGYGDQYPVTLNGRVIGTFLLFAGICLFSVLTGFIANAFLAPRTRLRRARRADDVTAALAAVRDLLTEQEDRADDIRQRIDEVERLVELGADRRGDSG
jgi:voltage-gated potassium channel